MSDLKRSLTEVTMNSNVVTLENLNAQEQKIFNKTTRGGKLYKGPNWSAYGKENLGTIPRNIEKSLVENKNSMSKIGFSTQSERFFNSSTSNKTNPGPGTYNVSGDLEFTRTSSSFYSSKGFGNGFISNTERFDTKDLFYCKYSPGPCEYDHQKRSTVSYEVNKSIFNRSLYNKKENPSLKIRRNTPGPGYYNPLKNSFDTITKKNLQKGNDPFFKSKVNRFNKENKSSINYPGPGQYFKDESLVNYNDKYNSEGPSYFFRSPIPHYLDPKGEEILEKYDIQTKQIPNNYKYNIPRGKLKKSYRNNINFKDVKSFERDNLSQGGKKSGHNKKLHYKKEDADLIVYNMDFDSDQGIEYIHNILEKKPKQALFKLNSARWKVNELQFKVPGPAYYHPRVPYKALSFNRNKKDFIWTPGANVEDYECLK